VLGKMRFSNKA